MPKAKTAIVQSVFDFAIREINALEHRIIKAEDDADAMLWEQARQVVEQLKAGLSTRKLAAQWFNPRNKGEAYSQRHVLIVKEAFTEYFNIQPRPRFREIYNQITNASASNPHVSQNSGNNEWYTPGEYIEAARTVLGEIDLDPASSPDANAIVRAAEFYTLADNGLEQPWHGRIWLNPPYAQPAIEHFAGKLSASVFAGDVSAAVVLVNNATETEWFRTIASVARAICFPEGRVRFWSPDRDSATPLQGQAVLYVGDAVDLFARAFAPFGVVLVKPEGAA